MFYKAGSLEVKRISACIKTLWEQRRRVGKDTFIINGLGTEGDKARYFIKKI